MDKYISICSPARLSDGSTLDMVIDIDNNKIELISGDGKGAVGLDLICAAELEKNLNLLVNSKGFQAALLKKISEHTGRVYTEDRPAS